MLNDVGVIAFALLIIACPTLAVDVYRFILRELEWRRFTRLHRGDWDEYLPREYSAANVAALHQRLLAKRGVDR